ncbi:MAG: hypothetical protein A2622_12810 [Bdellovibrionales bacterium RIFCSPHIGHO2_01_FULL_40_29]|nr:MAG: hypothetical protein A2622_12810 [Bdellovibrionales bacterium RIFCSPHIGHO2_01_FULL_40_29]OFZ33424.1 MAG: hypothetical protein A3D17_14075 [Bdellovibrionales bacterium RIFCSPHIGHO2_02_FULL_40_15]
MKTVIDFRDIQPKARHAIFLSIFEGLKPGSSFEFINDHEPRPLQMQVEQLQPENLIWESFVTGPDIWCVRIVKKNQDELSQKKSCCGVCGDS